MTTTRRNFLGTTTAGAAAVATGLNAQDSSNAKKLKLGIIGAGGYGMVNAKAALKDGNVEISALCDVDSDHLVKSAEQIEKIQGSRPRQIKLHKDLLGLPELDGVIIASPPQWHALQFIDALEAGLDIYCEKPLAYDVREGQAMIAAAKKKPDRVVQIGFQRRQSAAFKEAADFIKSGGIGRIVQADVQIHYKAGTKDPSPVDPPATLDWDLWCGPAPLLPYSEQIGHKSWRLEKTTGHGHLVDWGIHNIDAVRMMFGLGMPKRITADGGNYQIKDIITTPDTLSAHFEFEEFPVVWRHRLWGATEAAPEFNNGIFVFCEKATVFASDRKWIVLRTEGRNNTVREEHEAKVDLGTDHMASFLKAVRTRGPVSCPIEDAWKSTATVQLGMIAYESGSTVNWDEKTKTISGNSAAAELLKRDYRKPWEHPYLES